MSDIHELKTDIYYYDDVLSGKKNFEIRKDDRDFKVGDVLHLREYDLAREMFTGRSIYKKVTYILRDQSYVGERYVIMSVSDE